MPFLSLLVVSLLHFASGDAPKLKVMFFGDSIVSGIHNSDVDICPFRYDFLRRSKKEGKEVTIVGTNADKEGACQKTGEDLSLKNNGYQNAKVDELLDFITSDLQYLGNPVDYIFTSVGLQDCLQWKEGTDLQIISQQVRRIMGRLLNLNKNAKIYHIPLMLPPSAPKSAVDCVSFVNQKLRDVYDLEKKHDRILVVDPLHGQELTDDMFLMVGSAILKATKADEIKAEATNPPAPSVDAVNTIKVGETKAEVTEPLPAETTEPLAAEATEPLEPSVDAKIPASDSTAEVRRLNQIFEYLPNKDLAKMISNELITTLDWKFRAQTPTPTMAVTKDADYYGYDWCTSKYEKDECFEYYYGYVWCLQKYSNDECYNYYYGKQDTWEEKDSYKWCLNFYDEEYCSFAYKGQEPDTWDWLSFGYHDCLKTKNNTDCFEQYYGYAWCVSKYSDKDCYEYYYGSEGWVWDENSNYKWCINFYSDDECKAKYLNTTATTQLQTQKSGYILGLTPMKVGIIVIAISGILLFCAYRNLGWFRKNEMYSSLPIYGGDDEVELL